MAELIRDGNRITVAGGQSSVDATAVLPFKIDPVTGRLLTDTASGGTGTVTSVSVVSANGFAGTVATATTTPAITLSTTVTGILKGNGTTISAASAGTDYQAPITLTTTGTSGAATFVGNTLNIPQYTGGGGSGTVNSGTTGTLAYYPGNAATVGPTSGASVAASISAGTLTLGSAGAGQGAVALFNNSGTGTTSIQGNGATSSTFTLTLPAASDTLVGKATTDTFTNKTYDTAGTGNSFSINGVAVTANQGTGAVVRATSPTLTTPVLGVATATSINGNTFTTGTYTLTGTAGKTLTFQNSLTLAGTDATTMTFPTTSKTIAANDGTNWTIASQAIGDLAFANSTTSYSRIAAVAVGQVLVSAGTGTQPVWSAGPQVTTIELGNATDTTIARVSGGVISVEGSTVGMLPTTQTWTGQNKFNNFIDVNNAITASGNAATVPVTFRLNTVTNNSAATLTITMATASAVDGQMVIVRVLDFSAVAQTLAWVNTENSTVTAPTTTNGSTTLFLTVGFIYNGGTSKWRCIASA